MSAEVGRSLGRYRLDAPLGQGGMAEVWRATDTKLARTVAVKVILKAYASQEHFLERFLREARTVASLEHPSILPVYDFGEENGVPFLVMPYLPGGSLRERLKAGPVPRPLASAWISELAGALDAAHAGGVLHRDVKPANVLVGRDERLFLADFGIAKILESQSGLTATGIVVGTPIYMAPEQAQGRPATGATDRYALAVVAYEILAGRPPFEGDNPLSLMHQHVTTPPPALSTRVAGLPAGLDDVFSRALAKDPAARPPTCRALADDIAAFLPAASAPPPAGVTAPAATPPVIISGARPGLTSEQTVLTADRRPSRRGLYAGAAAAVVLAGAWWFGGRRAAPEPVQVAAATAPPEPTAAVPAPTAAATHTAAPRAAPRPVRPQPEPVPPPPAAPEPAPPPALEDPAHPMAAARARLEPSRKLTHRLSKEDFQFVLDEAERVRGERPRNADVKYFETYARGGLAYVAGKDGAASALLVEAVAELSRHKKKDGHPFRNLLLRPDGTIARPNGWELALAYGDARGEAAGLIDEELARNPRNVRALRARAQLRRMQGLAPRAEE